MLNANLRNEELYRSRVFSSMPERIEHDRKFVRMVRADCRCPYVPSQDSLEYHESFV